MDDLEGFPSTSLISSMVSNICDGTRNETIVSFVEWLRTKIKFLYILVRDLELYVMEGRGSFNFK